MPAKFVQVGDIIDHKPTSDVSAGDVVVIGGTVGVAHSNIAANDWGSIRVAGVFDFDKPEGAGTAFTAGGAAYYDTSNGLVYNANGSGRVLINGVAIEGENGIAGDDDDTVRVRLNQ